MGCGDFIADTVGSVLDPVSDIGTSLTGPAIEMAAKGGLGYGAGGLLPGAETAYPDPTFIGGGVDQSGLLIPDPYAAGSLTGQAADLTTAYGQWSPFQTLANLGKGALNWMTAPGGASGGGGKFGPLGSALNIGSGLYGLYKSDQLRKMAELASRRADTWGENGGRGLAAGQLQTLLTDPSSITKMPGYNAGLEAVQRAMAAQGYGGGAGPGNVSGNMLAALQQYGGNFYNQALQNLAGLSGATQNPASAGQLLISGNQLSNDLASRSLASIGYGVGGSNPNAFTEQILQAVRKMQGGV